MSPALCCVPLPSAPLSAIAPDPQSLTVEKGGQEDHGLPRLRSSAALGRHCFLWPPHGRQSRGAGVCAGHRPPSADASLSASVMPVLHSPPSLLLQQQRADPCSWGSRPHGLSSCAAALPPHPCSSPPASPSCLLGYFAGPHLPTLAHVILSPLFLSLTPSSSLHL